MKAAILSSSDLDEWNKFAIPILQLAADRYRRPQRGQQRGKKQSKTVAKLAAGND